METCENCAYFNVCGDIERTEPCASKKEKITAIRYQEIAEKAVSKLMEIDSEEAMEFLRNELDLTEEEKKYFEIPTEDDDYEEDPAAWEDDSYRSCKDCPDDECTGHCMSCYYRTV